jgi:hypothetical protein
LIHVDGIRFDGKIAEYQESDLVVYTLKNQTISIPGTITIKAVDGDTTFVVVTEPTRNQEIVDMGFRGIKCIAANDFNCKSRVAIEKGNRVIKEWVVDNVLMYYWNTFDMKRKK